jgi:hypothetical protein
MLRSFLFVAAALSAGAVCAQVTDDPQAAAPVVYDDAPAADCGSALRNADGSPVMNCAPRVASENVERNAEPEEVYDDAPVYDVPDYYTTGDFYPGVSLLPAYDYYPYGYGYGWGWPYYAYAPFGYWPSFSFAFFGGGFRHGHGFHDHDGRDHHGGHDHGYHGPYRYVGNGHYWNETHPNARTSGTAAARFAGNRDATSQRGTQNRAAFAPQNTATRTAPATRTALPSASYYAANRNAGMANNQDRAAVGATNRSAALSPTARNVGARNPYWVTALPSSRYAGNAARTNNGVVRSYAGYGVNRSYAPGTRGPQAAYAPRSGYATPRTSGGYRSGYSAGYSGRSGVNASGRSGVNTSRAWASRAPQTSHAAPHSSGGGSHSAGNSASDHHGR